MFAALVRYTIVAILLVVIAYVLAGLVSCTTKVVNDTRLNMRASIARVQALDDSQVEAPASELSIQRTGKNSLGKD